MTHSDLFEFASPRRAFKFISARRALIRFDIVVVVVVVVVVSITSTEARGLSHKYQSV